MNSTFRRFARFQGESTPFAGVFFILSHVRFSSTPVIFHLLAQVAAAGLLFRYALSRALATLPLRLNAATIYLRARGTTSPTFAALTIDTIGLTWS